MVAVYDIGKMLAGVAIFLLGMSFMEDTMRRLAGRKFKLFLKKHTSQKAKAITGGAVIAGALQSSSIVNLLVLSLVGSGVLKLANGLAVVLGANLGSTFTNWIVALFGFSYNIDNIALPVAGLSGIILTFAAHSGRLYKWSRLFLGFSFLFIGVGFIKDGMLDVVKTTGFTNPGDHSALFFFVTGILLTTLIQSSSATIALTLAGLYAGIISLPGATAIALGAEIGTTSKLFLASARGAPSKKRLALGNFLFNTITSVLLLFFLVPLNGFITSTLGIGSNLLALVTFQTIVNIAGILLFYPLLNVMGRFLEKKFTGRDKQSIYIDKVETSGAQASVEAMEKETRRFIFYILIFMKDAFNAKNEGNKFRDENYFPGASLKDKYGYTKHLYGEIHGFYIQRRNLSPPRAESERLEQLMDSARNGMYAAKNINDMWQDIEQLRNSSNDIKYGFYMTTRQKIIEFSDKVYEIMHNEKGSSLRDITGLYGAIQQDYTSSLQQLYRESTARAVNEVEITTLLNFNRELYTALKSVVFGVINYVLQPGDAESFEKLPGFIR